MQNINNQTLYQILQIVKTQVKNIEMQRTQFKRTFSKPSIFQVSTAPLNQQSQTNIRMPQHFEFAVPLQKTRTYSHSQSHKKLSLTSTMPNPVSQIQPVKKAIPVFEASRFYRPLVKGVVIGPSKKIGFQDAKVSLKISAAGNEEIRSMVSIADHNQSETSQLGGSKYQNQNMQQKLKEYMNSKLQFLSSQISNQTRQICQLQQKIAYLQQQVRDKSQQISMLQIPQTPIAYDKSILNRRIADLQKILHLTSIQSTNIQDNINIKLDTINKKLVQIKIRVEADQLRKMNQKINEVTDKIDMWCCQRQNRLHNVQEICKKVDFGIKEIVGEFRLMGYRIAKLQEESARRDYSLKIGDTKDSIDYWETFQDYVITTRSQHQLKNNSTLSQDDFFFHPQIQQFQKINVKCDKKDQSRAVTSPSDQNTVRTSSLTSLVQLMGHLKQNYEKLPIRCRIDKHGRIWVKQENRLLMNQENRNFYKVSEDQAGILENRGYLHIDKYN